MIVKNIFSLEQLFALQINLFLAVDFVHVGNQYGAYISKINCFCYDARTLKPKEKDKYSLVMFIDPEVTKDNKTKNVKEITIQFIFFDYKEYKKSES